MIRTYLNLYFFLLCYWFIVIGGLSILIKFHKGYILNDCTGCIKLWVICFLDEIGVPLHVHISNLNIIIDKHINIKVNGKRLINF